MEGFPAPCLKNLYCSSDLIHGGIHDRCEQWVSESVHKGLSLKQLALSSKCPLLQINQWELKVYKVTIKEDGFEEQKIHYQGNINKTWAQVKKIVYEGNRGKS